MRGKKVNLYGIETGYALRAVVKTMLMYPHAFEWSVQGFGMLRAYFDKDKVYRLNIWDHDLAVPNVSVIHDHPWSFTSWIINGEATNTKDLEFRLGRGTYDMLSYWSASGLFLGSRNLEEPAVLDNPGVFTIPAGKLVETLN